MIATEAQIEAFRVEEALHGKSRGYQQHQRYRNLRDNKEIAQSEAAAARDSLGLAALERWNEIGVGALEGGRQPENDAGGKRDDQREEQDPGVEPGGEGNGHIGRQLDGTERVHAPVCKQQAERSAK